MAKDGRQLLEELVLLLVGWLGWAWPLLAGRGFDDDYQTVLRL